MRLVSAKEFRQHYKISYSTLQKWRNGGVLKYKKISDRKYLYDIDFLEEESDKKDDRENVIYARVSTTKQKEQLDHQIETIKGYMISNGITVDKIYKDIASGMNCNRKDLNILMTNIVEGKIAKVFISYKDRLTRFGFEYLEHIFKLHNVEIVILDKTEISNNSDFNAELANDIISIIHHYSMKLYSNRRKQLKEIEEIIKENK